MKINTNEGSPHKKNKYNMNILGYTIDFTKEDFSRIKNFYYGKNVNDNSFYDEFFKKYDSLSDNKKAIVVYLTFWEMLKRHTENLSQNERENVQSSVFYAIAKNIRKLDIRYRGLAKYINTVIKSRIINEVNLTKRYGSLVDENTEIDSLSDEIECDRDYNIQAPTKFDSYIRDNGEYGQLVMDIYQEDIRTAQGLLKRALLVEPGADRDKLKIACTNMIRYIKKGA